MKRIQLPEGVNRARDRIAAKTKSSLLKGFGQLHYSYAPAAEFHFVHGANERVKVGETAEEHRARVVNNLSKELGGNRGSIYLRNALFGENPPAVGRRATLARMLSENKVTEHIQTAARDPAFLEAVSERGIRHKLMLAHFLSGSAGQKGGHATFFRKQLREAMARTPVPEK